MGLKIFLWFLYLLACCVNGMVVTHKNKRGLTWQYWVSMLCIIVAYLIGHFIEY